jgi:long-chain fatty acid transport protein
MRTILVALLFVPAVARAGGFEILEQSPQGVATVGAQTAVAEDASAVFYNPAGMAFQPGMGALVGGTLGYVSSEVDSTGQTVNPTHVGVAANLYLSQRLGKHWAIGIGAFSNFAEHFNYPSDFNGRFLGQFVDVTTATINPAVAWRPIRRLAFGVGLDIVIGSLDLYQALNFGGGEGMAHAGMTGVGVGGNAGLMVDIVERYLRFGFSYRSRSDIHFDGRASVTAPPELQSMVGAETLSATTTLPLPHNFTFALSSRPIDALTLSVDVHYTLWHDIATLTLQQSGGAMTMSTQAVLDLHDSWGVRVGGELRVISDGRLRIRLGAGWDQTPVPAATLGPLIPDSDRVVVGGGLGYHAKRYSIEAGYLAAILLKSTSQNPDLHATYSTVGHVVSAAFTLRFSDVGGKKLSGNEVAWSDPYNRPAERRVASR